MTHSVKSDIAFAYIVQIVSMLTSVIMSLIVPKMLDIEEFSYWQLFILYSSYVSITTLGIHDGLYLINGGLTRDQINKPIVGSQLAYMFIAQAIAGCVIVLGSLFFFGGDRQLVFILLGIYLVLFNIDGSLRVLFQAIDEVRLSSKAYLMLRVSFLILLAGLLICNCQDCIMYILAYVVAEAIACLYSVFHARDILFAKLMPIQSILPAIRESLSAGFKLMISMQISMLVVGLSRFFVEWFWPQYTFGQYSFAISLITFFNAFIVQAALVFFPFLRKMTERTVRIFFIKAEKILSALMPAVLICSYFLKHFIALWLPQYLDSFAYLCILLPVCIFDSKMEICCSTLFKVRREESKLLIINIVSLIVAISANVYGYVSHSIDVIIVGTVFASVVRCVLSELHFSKSIKSYESLALSAYLIGYSIVFVLSSTWLQTWIGLAVSFALYLPLPIYMWLHHKSDIHER